MLLIYEINNFIVNNYKLNIQIKKFSKRLIILFSFIILFIIAKYINSGFRLFEIKSNLVILIILIFFNLILFYFIKKNHQSILIIVISIIFSFYLIDFLFVLKNNILKIENKNNYRFINESKFDIFTELNKKKIVSSPTFSLNKLFKEKYIYKNKEIKILSMQSKSLMIHCKRNGEWIFFNSDRYGFNNNDKNWENYNTVLVGDSFGIGECVENKDSIAGIISNNNTVGGLINLSQTGNGPLLELATLIEYPDKKKIKNLIWLYFEGNDLLELRDEKKIKILNNYLYIDNYSQNLKNSQLFINKQMKKFIKLKKIEAEDKIKSGNKITNDGLISETNHLITFINFIKLSYFRRYLNFSNYTTDVIRYVDSDFFKIIKKAHTMVEENNGKMIFVYLPTMRDKINNAEKKNLEISRKLIISELKKLGIEVVDIYQEVYLKSKDPYNFIDKYNGHYTIDTYKKIAESIINRIN